MKIPASTSPGWLWLAAALSTGGYLLASWSAGFVGFTLDDAWIHQTYARNLGLHGQFAFIPGQPSAGSTSPLWTALLALGYLLRIDYHLWTYGLGAAALGLNAWLARRLLLTFWPERATAALLAGLFVAVEWHLVWAAGSGMEILLASALALSVFSLPIERPLILGGLVGLAVFTRPDGLALLPFALARLWLGGQGRVRRSLQCAAGFGLMAAPYLLLNYWLAGDLWPNTLYAKQAEYAVQREMPLLLRLWQVGAQPWIGATALLLPGVAFAVWGAARRRAWTVLLPLGWALAHIGAYALRLPVIYQYGRYVMPTIPVWIVIGTGGAAALLHLLALARPGGAGGRAAPALPRILSRTWLASLGLLALVFWGIGAGVYRRDVRIIETEMVATAKWVAAHTPPEALVAAHDIGALGYFGERRLLDLAGLVSPEVIPFIRDEARLGAWLDQAGAHYLVTFPGWYAELDRGLPAVYQTTAPFAPQAGGENMAVYAWPAPPP